QSVQNGKGYALLQRLDCHRQILPSGLPHQQMDMLRHNHISNDHQLIFLANSFQRTQKKITSCRQSQEWQATVTTESDEMKVTSAIETFEPAWHWGSLPTPFSSHNKFVPTRAGRASGAPQAEIKLRAPEPGSPVRVSRDWVGVGATTSHTYAKSPSRNFPAPNPDLAYMKSFHDPMGKEDTCPAETPAPSAKRPACAGFAHVGLSEGRHRLAQGGNPG